MRAPALPLTAPPPTGGGTREPCTPAPVETILAVMARLASHVWGEPLSVTVTQPMHAIDVNLRERAEFDAWRRMLPAGPDSPGRECETRLHGWRVRLRLVP